MCGRRKIFTFTTIHGKQLFQGTLEESAKHFSVSEGTILGWAWQCKKADGFCLRGFKVTRTKEFDDYYDIYDKNDHYLFGGNIVECQKFLNYKRQNSVYAMACRYKNGQKVKYKIIKQE